MHHTLSYKRLLPLFIMLVGLYGCQGGDKPSQQKLHADGGVFYASLSNNSHYAMISAVNQPTTLWDLQTDKPLYSWQNTRNDKNIIATAFSPAAKYALTASPHSVALWDAKTGKTIVFWRVKTPITTVALSPGGHYALIGYKANNAEYIDLNEGRSVRRFQHTAPINSVAISNNERYALTGSDDKTAVLWNIQTGKAIHHWQHKKRVTQVAISPNSHYAVTAASQGQVLLWDLRSGKLIRRLGNKPTSVTAMRFSQDDRLLAVGTMPQALSLWNLENGKRIQNWKLAKPSHWKPSSVIIYAVSFSEDGSKLHTEDSSGNHSVWPIAQQ